MHHARQPFCNDACTCEANRTNDSNIHAKIETVVCSLKNICEFLGQGQAAPLTGSRALRLVNHSCEENSTRAALRAATGDNTTV